MLLVHPVVAICIPLLALVIGGLIGSCMRPASEADAWTHGYECGQRAAREQFERDFGNLPEPRIIGEE